MPNPGFTLFGLNLHWYGLLLALAILVSYRIAEKRVQRLGISADAFSRLAVLALVFGFVGARLWHVATDWWDYLTEPLAVFYVWRGGLSIFGGLLGGAIGLWWGFRCLPRKQVSFLHLSDSIILALPIGQAIGRLGNWVNQELYGLPTNLPWKIYISPEHRLPGFEQFSYYHPLFAYEAGALVLFAIAVWQLEKIRPQTWRIGRGWITVSYIFFYCGLRFLLDFIRPDKQLLFAAVGVNQVVVALVAISLGSVLYLRKATV